MSNYYTPKEEEFHKGSRYEKKSGNGDWEEYVYGITPGASRNISSDLSRDRQTLEGNYRVKYLDQEDIEELGWEYHSKNYDGGELTYKYTLPNDPYSDLYLVKRDTQVDIIEGDKDGYNWEYPQLFSGKIKNYNELKTIMEMTDIRKDKVIN